MKKLTNEDFIEMGKNIHNNEYSYEKTVLVNTKTPVIVTCSKHGDFEVIPSVHLRGAKCKECKKAGIVDWVKTKDFIELAKEIHGDEFDYSKVEYINDKSPITIICKKHGEFQTKPVIHKQGYKCPVCRYGGNSDEKVVDFIKKAKEIHVGRDYDYSKVSFKIKTDKVTIVCPTHGEFSQKAGAHLLGQKCPDCAKIEGDSKQKRLTESEILLRAANVHGDTYEYDLSEYVSSNEQIKIKCKKHGWFKQLLFNHLKGSGCLECGIDVQRNTLADFLDGAKEIHGDKYNYSLCTSYTNVSTDMNIICSKHGVFQKTYMEHIIFKSGCPSCSHTSSKFEQWVAQIISEVSGEIPRKKRLSNNKEIDVVYNNIGFEANGLLYHCEGLVNGHLNNGGKDRFYHLNKSKQAEQEGIKLYHIFENEYIERTELVKNKILNACGLNVGKKVNGRDCEIIELIHTDSFNFLETYHIQGGDTSPIRYGAVLDGEIVGVMTFKKTDEAGVFDLNRYATNYNYHIRGLASKMLKRFERDYSPSKIKTFADIRWTPDPKNNLYVKLGFDLIEQQPPVYHYYNRMIGTKLFNRMRFQKHKILKENPQFDPSMTEKEMMIALGYDRVWDCGNWKFEKTYK